MALQRLIRLIYAGITFEGLLNCVALFLTFLFICFKPFVNSALKLVKFETAFLFNLWRRRMMAIYYNVFLHYLNIMPGCFGYVATGLFLKIILACSYQRVVVLKE